jgi:hypothetical protein
MTQHVFRIAGVTILALALMFYPFLPGTHDRLAVTLATMALMLGWAGLLLVPIGAIWLVYELMRRRTKTQREPTQGKGHYFAIAAMAASLVVAAAVALAAAIQTGPSLAVGVLLFWAYVVYRLMPRVTRLKEGGGGGFNPAPLYMLIVPSVLVVAHLTLLKPAVEFSRNRAIMGSAKLIKAIEAYRAAHGRYPLSLASSISDYDPPVVGVERYHYEPSERAYNVFFEQFTYPIGVQEFVMYNPLDEQTLMVHDQDLLEATQEQIDAERAYHLRHNAHAVPAPAPPHWKYFWFD